MSWKISVDEDGSTDSLRFATEDEASSHGNELYRRWFGCPSRPTAVPSDDPVNYTWNDDDGAVRITDAR